MSRRNRGQPPTRGAAPIETMEFVDMSKDDGEKAAKPPADPDMIPPLKLELPFESPPSVPLTLPEHFAYINAHSLVHGSRFYVYHDFLRVAATLESDGMGYAARIHYAARSAFVPRQHIVVSE